MFLLVSYRSADAEARSTCQKIKSSTRQKWNGHYSALNAKKSSTNNKGQDNDKQRSNIKAANTE